MVTELSRNGNDSVIIEDVGKAPLEGRSGIRKGTSGWKGYMEINRVYYDQSVISIREMEDALKESGTYKKTVKGE